MSTLNNSLLLGAPASGGYQIQRSLRFSSSDSAFLSRTPASAGNRKTWTWAGWVKRAISAVDYQNIFCAGDVGVTNRTFIRFNSSADDSKIVLQNDGGWSLSTSAVYRDPSAWYHITVAIDTTHATATDRAKLWINGIAQTLSGTNPTLDEQGNVNNTKAHYIGSETYSSGREFDGYLADVHFIDGQALTPSSFTEVSATTGQLIPKAYTGSFGTNGFWLKFSDNSAATATTLGKDYSGNSNNWTPNNLSVTAGAGNDSLTDTPTSYGTDTGAGGEVRGNYATLNPLTNIGSYPSTLSNGNLEFVGTASSVGPSMVGTLGVSSGKWYFEAVPSTANAVTSGQVVGIVGVQYNPVADSDSYFSRYSFGYGYRGNGQKENNNTAATYGASYALGDVIGVAYDLDAGTITFYKNGVSQGQAYSGISGTFYPSAYAFSSRGWTLNFGQRPFAYPAPSGFKALCDTNLPAPVVAKPSTVFDTTLYTGNGSTQTISGLGFSPDFAWFKVRNNTSHHTLYDIVRGATKSLCSSNTNAEATEGGGLSAFTSDGFSLSGDNTIQGSTNANGGTYVAWTWDAGSSTVTNTQGSITSQVRANASAGFSIVTYSGNSSTATVGHGLNVAPSWIIIKNRTSAYDWIVYANESGTLKQLYLNLTLASSGSGLSLPSSTTFNLPGGGASGSNETGKNYVAYCFAPVAGYSAFGSYEGSGSTQFVYTGFRPKFLIVKCSAGSSTQEWVIKDGVRNPYNAANFFLYANASDAEGSSARDCDFLSNGFSIPGSIGPMNFAGRSYIYIAFAESPFQYARAR